MATARCNGHNSIALLFDDMTEFWVMKPYVDELVREGMQPDIIVQGWEDNRGLEETYRKIKSLGYKPKRTTTKKYKILLEPYPVGRAQGVEAEYRLKYLYAPIIAKPDPSLSPEYNMPYDAIFTFSKRDAEIHSVYAKTYIIPYKKYVDFKREKHGGKPNLLYLPTFGDDVSSIGDLAVALRKMKQKYTLQIKAHHAVEFRADERERLQMLKDMADEFFDSSTPLSDLLKLADVVLSDNSGAIFDSLFAGVPVAIYSKNPNARCLGGVNTYQSILVHSGVIPCTSKASEIPRVLKKAAGKKVVQNKLRSQLLSAKQNNYVDFLNVMKDYLMRDPLADEYHQAHKILYEDWLQSRWQIDDLRRRVNRYERSFSRQVTKPLRKIVSLARRKAK